MRAPNNETHRLRYATWDERFRVEKPYTIVSDMPWLEGTHKTNLTFAEAPEEVITDVRGHENEFNLDDNGFTYISYKFPSIDMLNEAVVKEILYPKAEEFLKTRVAGVDRVYLFDYRVRFHVPSLTMLIDCALASIQRHSISLQNDRNSKHKPTSASRERGTHWYVKVLSPVGMPEVTNPIFADQSPGGALRRVRAWMGDETDYLLRGRVRIIKSEAPILSKERSGLTHSHCSLWFPYDYPITDCPLAVCDGSTIRAEDMLAADHVTRTYIGETVFPLYNKDAKWFYLSNQKPDEVLVFKVFDSDDKVKAKGKQHQCWNVNSCSS